MNKLRYAALSFFIIGTLTVIFTVNLWKEKVTCHPASLNSDMHSLSVNKSNQYKVPNIVHYIWYRDGPVALRFDQALSILSAIKFIKPEAVYFHTNMEPTGQYYQMLKNNSVFKVIHREPPSDILRTVYHETDFADFDRVKIVTEQGGIYLDLDIMIIRPFDDLRKYDCTLGFQSPGLVCAGVIICVKNYPFLYLWLNSYFDDFRSNWAYNSGGFPSCLVRRYRGMVHIEENKLHKPGWRQLDQIWGNVPYPWPENYSVHTWIRLALNEWIKEYPTADSIKTMNTTYGQIARRVFYGSPGLILTQD